MTREEQLNQLESEEIAKAIKGDLGARLRVEILIPYGKTLSEQFEAICKMPPGKARTEKVDVLMTAFTGLVGSQIALLVGHASNGCIPQSLEILGMVMQSLGDRAAESIINVHLMQEMERRGKL